MAESPPKNSPSPSADHQIVPSHSDLVVLVPARDDSRNLLVEQVPPWVAEWAGKSPKDIEGRPADEVFGGIVDALPAIAEDVLSEAAAIEDYCIEFTDCNGAHRAAVIAAHRVDDYSLAPTSPVRERARTKGPAVLMRISDVTSSVMERRQALGIGAFHGIVGRSKAMLNVFYKIEVYGPTDAPVVVSGETGTGKELVARALHERSRRRNQPFVAVNCTALSEELFESELFGHERGAFTGAVRSHKGRFERAHKGTLFLDEIGDMPPRTQAKLLRALEQGTIERVGGEREMPVDVRILAATNISLEQAVAVGRFRADLYHRLSVFRIHVPPLRERMEDLPLLVEHFLEILNRRYGRRHVRLTPEAMRLLAEYHWPGNVRELRNVLERVYVETRGTVIGRNAFEEWVRERDYLSAGGWNLEQLENRRAVAPAIVTPFQSGHIAPHADVRLPAPPGPGRQAPDRAGQGPSRFPTYPLAPATLGPAPQAPPGFIDAVYSVAPPATRKPKQLTEEMIREAFERAGGNATRAARLLGVHKATLYRHMKALNLTRESLGSTRAASDTTGQGPSKKEQSPSGSSE